MNCKERQDLIDAFIDEELDLVRQLEMEQHLKGCAACAARAEQRRSLQVNLRRASLRFQTPPALERRLHGLLHRGTPSEADVSPGLSPARRFFWSRPEWWGGFVSAAVLTSALFVAAPYLARPALENRLAQEVVNSHVRSLMSNHLTDVVTSNQHVVKPWFNGRVDFSPTVKDLTPVGFPLAGGRLDHVDNHTVATLIYHRALHPISLFTWPEKDGRDIPLRPLTRRGYHLLHWVKGGMAYWIISDLNENDLKDFARLIND